MVYLKLQFLLFIITMKKICVASSHEILLTVYYESKCPDSKSFILRQLRPTMHLLHDYVQLKLVPFGKAMSINYGDDGFECQHGPTECQGNIVQDCSLHLMEGQSNHRKLEYVACEMETEAGSQGKLDCAEKAGLFPEHVEDCVLLGKGTVLQLESEYYTSLLQPQFIPTITVNGIFDQYIQDNAQVDLLGTLCEILLETPPCAHYYNKLALTHLLYKREIMK